MEQYAPTPESTESNLFELQIDHELSGTMNDISKWGKFLGIAGFIITGIILLVILLVGKVISALPISSFIGAGGGIITTIYIIIAALFFFPSLFVYNFSRKVQYALRNNDQETLNNAFSSLKIRFKFIGIFWIVIFSLWTIGILKGLF